MANLIINTASTRILKYDKEFFGAYDKIIINSASAILSKEAYKELSERVLVLNAASTELVELKGEPVYVGNAVIDGNTDYSGKHIIGDNIQITDKNALTGAAGLVADNIIAPEGIRFDFKVDGKIHYYPENARIISKNIKLTGNYVANLGDGTLLWTRKRVSALDDKAVAALSARDITIHCGHLLITEGAMHQYGHCFKAADCEIVPDGFEYIDDDFTLNMSNYVLYGDKLYIKGEFKVTANAITALKQFTDIVVSGGAVIPIDAVSHWKEIGSAENVTAYKDELWFVDGQENISHGQLEAARAGGLKYTFIVEGMVKFDKDVIADDLTCFTDIYNSGMINLPDHLIPMFKSKVVKNDGRIEPLKLEKEETDNEADNQNTVINAANFIRV